ncbi:MAG: outer membrane protein transport protein [Myxococcales bacterium]|nr:outer membrane protein transport protein [Myxococcales bacterium]
MHKRALWASVAVAVTTIPAAAWGGGLYFSERGVRPLARGGAFVAGADDLGAIWYNPAGVYDAGDEFLLDATWLHFETQHQRRAIVEQSDPNTGAVVARYEQTFAPVDGVSPVLPIPTIAGSFRPHPDWAVAFGVLAPDAAITSFPEEVDGGPAPQRYALITLDGSLLLIAGAWAAWAPVPEVRVGLGVEALVGKFVSTVMSSACIPDRFFCAQEQPSWDTEAQLAAGPIFAPSVNLGATFLPHPEVRLGLGFHLPFWVRAPGSFVARLPSTPVFETAYQEGSDVSVAFDLPWTLHLGVEWRPVERLRLELSGSVEGWSMHDSITVTPEGAALRGVVGLPDPYYIPTQVIPRGFQESGSVRLGGEYGIPIATYQLDVRGGLGFETSAIPSEYLSALTVDMNKVTLGMGVGFHVAGWRFDLTYAHIFGLDVDVDPETAQIPLLTPVNANMPARPHTINGGSYSANANILGVGLTHQFDYVEPAAAPAPDGPQAAPTDVAPAADVAPDASDSADGAPEDGDTPPPPKKKPPKHEVPDDE